MDKKTPDYPDDRGTKYRKPFFISVAVLSAICLSLSLVAWNRRSNYRSAFESAEACYAEKAYTEAVEYLKQALELRHTEECYLLYADIYYYGFEDLDRAIDILYVGVTRVKSTALSEQLDVLKKEKRQRNSTEQGVLIGSVRIALDAETAVLSGQNLKDGDLAEITQLTRLKSLTLSENTLSDLTPLSGLSTLTTLYVENNQITDLTPLTEMIQLRTLYLDGNPIEDFSALYNLKNLTTLSIKNIQISAEQYEALEEALPRCHIYYGDVPNEEMESTMD